MKYGLSFCAVLFSCFINHAIATEQNLLIGKKVLFVNSYHSEYQWSQGLIEGAKKAFYGTKVEFKVIHMDTKRNKSEAFKQAAALQVKNMVTTFKPDVMITADDNAAKYVVVPYYKDTDLPIVFCGINWDAGVYGFPAENVTGMIEVDTVATLLQHLRHYAEGDRIGLLASDTFTIHKLINIYKHKLDVNLDKVALVTNFTEWKKEYTRLQSEVDILILGVTASIDNFDMTQAQEFVLTNTKIPSGVFQKQVSSLSLIAMSKIPQEHGYWAGNAALDVLHGKSIADIPITRNEEAEILLNIPLGNALGITFDMNLLKVAALIR